MAGGLVLGTFAVVRQWGARVAFVLAMAITVTGCNPQVTITLPPRTTPTAPSVTQSPGQATESVEVEPCMAAAAEATDIVASVDPPSAPVVPGAQGTEDIDFNSARRPLIPIDPDTPIADESDVPALTVTPPGVQVPPSESDLVVYGQPKAVNTGWEHNTTEPEVAVSGSNVLMTWNSLAALSTNGGQDFRYLFRDGAGPAPVPPFEAQPPFCCDQRALHDPVNDIWLWLLQYESEAGTSNRVRLTVANRADFEAGRFTRYWDFTPQHASYPDGAWFDHAKIATSAGHLFLSIDTIVGNDFESALVMRIPLADVVAGGAISPECLLTRYWSPYPVRNAGDTMYIAAESNSSTLAVFRWPDNAAAPTLHLARSTQQYSRPYHFDDDGDTVYEPYSCPRNDSTADRSGDWCFRPTRGSMAAGNSTRIRGGWLNGNEIGFAWNVPQDPSRGFNWPYVWMTAIDVDRLASCDFGECVIGHPSIRFPDRAVQYAAIAPNARGELGAVALAGGGDYFLTCLALLRDETVEGGWDWEVIAASNRDHANLATSGDYLGISTDSGRDNTWSASCMSIQDGLEAPNVVHFARFGRQVDRPG